MELKLPAATGSRKVQTATGGVATILALIQLAGLSPQVGAYIILGMVVAPIIMQGLQDFAKAWKNGK